MKTAIVARTFRRSDNKKIVRLAERITGEDAYIDELQRLRLVHSVQALTGAPETAGARPTVAASGPSSASQVDQASQQTTAPESSVGEEKPKRAKRRTAEE